MAYLHKRGYDQQFFRKEITRAKTIARNEVLLPENATTTKLNALHSYCTWNPALRLISFIICKRFSMLSSYHRCHDIFNSAPTVAFQRGNNLGNFLVRTKLPNPLKKQHTSPRLFSMRQPLTRWCSPIYPTGLVLTHSITQSEDLSTSLLSLKTLLFCERRHKQHRRNKTTTQRSLQRTPRKNWDWRPLDKPNLNISKRIRTFPH